MTRRGGEVVFNTSLTGYQEVFTDPSYAGQIVCLTYPHIGNVGANLDDQESERPYIEALVVREFSQVSSNWRSAETAQLYLNRHKIPVIWDIDTRALVRHLRLHGALRGMVATDGTPAEQLIHEANSCRRWRGRNWRVAFPPKKATSGTPARSSWPVRRGASRWAKLARAMKVGASCASRPTISESSKTFFDCWSITAAKSLSCRRRLLRKMFWRWARTACFLSNGPGDPEPATYAVENIRRLLGKVPVFGICLGHQLCGLALGGKTFKLKFGHHGANHPVKNLLTEQMEITSQNHGFCVDPESLPSSDVEITHLNLNDHTNEGFRHKSLPLFSVQYHPEASPGPHDSHYFFTQFTDLMKEFASPGSSRR